MRYKLKPKYADLIDRFSDFTRADPKMLLQRGKKLREAGILPDFRIAGTKLTLEHIADFIISIMATDDHVSGAEAALRFGKLKRFRKDGDGAFTGPGSLRSDLIAALQTSNGERLELVTIDRTTAHATVMLSDGEVEAGEPKRTLHQYGNDPRTTPVQSLPIEIHAHLDGRVIREMARLAQDDATPVVLSRGPARKREKAAPR